MGIGETHSLGAQSIEVGRRYFSAGMRDIAVAHVVSENEDEVRFGLSGNGRQHKEDYQQGEEFHILSGVRSKGLLDDHFALHDGPVAGVGAKKRVAAGL